MEAVEAAAHIAGLDRDKDLQTAGKTLSAVTQSAPPDGHMLGFKVHHLRM